MPPIVKRKPRKGRRGKRRQERSPRTKQRLPKPRRTMPQPRERHRRPFDTRFLALLRAQNDARTPRNAYLEHGRSLARRVRRRLASGNDRDHRNGHERGLAAFAAHARKARRRHLVRQRRRLRLAAALPQSIGVARIIRRLRNAIGGGKDIRSLAPFRQSGAREIMEASIAHGHIVEASSSAYRACFHQAFLPSNGLVS